MLSTLALVLVISLCISVGEETKVDHEIDVHVIFNNRGDTHVHSLWKMVNI